MYCHCMIRWDGDEMMCKNFRGLPNIYSPSLCLPPLPLYFCTPAITPWRWTRRSWWSVSGGHDQMCLEIHLETEIEWTQMHLEAVIERVWRCTWRLRSSQLRDAHGSHNWVCWEIHLEAIFEQDWRSTWRRLIWKRLIWSLSIWR